MKRKLLPFIFLLPTLAIPANRQSVEFGGDFALPFYILVDGHHTSDRGNLAMGLEARHWFTDQMNYGLKINFDLENRIPRQFGIEPGFAHHWMPTENWRPFIRFDLPLVLKGAVNSSGSSDEKDLGISSGVGFVWKFGEAIGVQRMEFRYDFDILYLFGAGGALSVFAIDLFRAGINYRF